MHYITQCLESIVHQSYSLLEVILIDDGSTDASGKICDEFAQKDNRIQVIHQINSGAAAARNTGLDVASGEYLAFVDSDDWLEKDAYEYLIEELQKEQADIVQSSYRTIYVNRQVDCLCRASGRVFDQTSYLLRFAEDWTCSLLWDKLYRRELLKDIRFETGHVIDDEYFTYQVVMNAQKVVCRDKIVYNYRMRSSGATNDPDHYERIVNDKLDYLTKRLDRISATYPLLTSAFCRHFLHMMIWISEDDNMTERALHHVQMVLRERWKQCRNSGEGWRTDLKLKKLMRSEPGEYLHNRTAKTGSEEITDVLFD